MALTQTEALWTIVGGVAGLAASLSWVLSTWQFEISARRADGTIIELIKIGYRDGYGQCYGPRFEFQTPDGERWTVDSAVGSSSPAFRVGDQVKVLYRPSDPSHAKIDSIGQLWLFPAIAIIVSMIAIVIGLAHI